MQVLQVLDGAPAGDVAPPLLSRCVRVTDGRGAMGRGTALPTALSIPDCQWRRSTAYEAVPPKKRWCGKGERLYDRARCRAADLGAVWMRACVRSATTAVWAGVRLCTPPAAAAAAESAQ